MTKAEAELPAGVERALRVALNTPPEHPRKRKPRTRRPAKRK